MENEKEEQKPGPPKEEGKKPEPAKEEKVGPAEPKKEEPKKEKPSACAKCGKKLKRKTWYYRNGKYYCNKRCWKQTKEKPKDS